MMSKLAAVFFCLAGSLIGFSGIGTLSVQAQEKLPPVYWESMAGDFPTFFQQTDN